MNKEKWRVAFLKLYLEGDVTLQGEGGQVTFTPDGEMRLGQGYERSLLFYDEAYAVLLRASFILDKPTTLLLDIVDGLMHGDPIAKRAVKGFIAQPKIQFLMDTFKLNFDYEEPIHDQRQEG